MENISLDKLLNLVKTYDPKSIDLIKKAYEYAKTMHEGQFRKSGEPYIIHPLCVAYYLAQMNADSKTICAGILHDTIEDTKSTKEELIDLFGPEIAQLVNGVTKLPKFNFSSKNEETYANERKFILGLLEDVRIIFIKLCDRLHNMRTLNFMPEYKQKKIANETLQIYVPLAKRIGASKIKHDLEDLAFYYLERDTYKSIEEKRNELFTNIYQFEEEILFHVSKLLKNSEIPNKLKFEIKNIYYIYRKSNKNLNIYDILALKTIVDNINNCYKTMGILHGEYHPLNEIKDSIYVPRANMYRSLDTILIGPNGKLFQAQIRTDEMDKVDTYGLAVHWVKHKEDAGYQMEKDLKTNYQCFDSLNEINKLSKDNQQFISKVQRELFSDKIYVFTPRGEPIELPIGSTPVDFAYKIHTDIGNSMVKAMVNDKFVPNDYVLKPNDRVYIITNFIQLGNRQDLLEDATTSLAISKIKKNN